MAAREREAAGTSGQREAQAARELGHTDVSAPVAGAVLAAFVLWIAWVGALQLAVQPPDLRPLLAQLPTACSLERFESALDEGSVVGGWLRPRLQRLWLRAGLGNEQVQLGRDGWLYQQADRRYASGPGFLDSDTLERRRRGADACARAPQPDPIAGIASFAAALDARGIRLLVVPVPVKGVAAPERLASDGRPGPLQNPSYPAFTAALAERGVALFDPTPLLLQPDSYLATDTHWRPEAMERVARALAEHIEAQGWLSDVPRGSYARTRASARHFGDLALALLPDPQPPFAAERVTTQTVHENGRPWQPTRGASLLLLGDSFSNIYSDAAAFPSTVPGDSGGWGERAGLAEQLSYALRRPVDKLARNAGAAHAVRADLEREIAQEAAQLRDRLAGVRVVVWEFAMRELSEGDWTAAQGAELPRGAQKGDGL